MGLLGRPVRSGGPSHGERGCVGDDVFRLPRELCEAPENPHEGQQALRRSQVDGTEELAQERKLIEVDPLADQLLIPVEDEEGGHADLEGTARRRYWAKRPAVRAKQIELDDHSVVAMP